MFRCEDVITELGNYLDDQVAAALRDEIQEHLSHCATCRVVFDSARKTLRVVTESGSFEIPGELSDRITRQIMDRIRAGGTSDKNDP